jgi:hypothetical protein
MNAGGTNSLLRQNAIFETIQPPAKGLPAITAVGIGGAAGVLSTRGTVL